MASQPSVALVEGVAGALGGVLGLAATYPLLAVATRLQLQQTVAAPAPAPATPPVSEAEKARTRSLGTV